MGWIEPGTGRPLAPPVAVGVGVPRRLYRSKVGDVPSRAESDRLEQLARLKALRDEVRRPTRAELKALAAEVHADETLGRLRAARDAMDRVGAQVRAWRRGAGRKASLPSTLARARDESFNAYTQAFVAAQGLLSTVGAVMPRLTRRELVSLRRQVHAAAAVRGRGRLAAAGSRLTAAGRGSVSAAPTLDPVPARWPAWRAEYRRISELVYAQDALVASAVPGSAGQRAALVEAARLRAQAVRLRGGG